MESSINKPWSYTVRCEFPDDALQKEWLTWLLDGHAQALLDAGAVSAAVVADASDPLRLEVRYVFPSRAAFQRYETKYAPALRNDGLNRFPPHLGIGYQRGEGPILTSMSTADDQLS